MSVTVSDPRRVEHPSIAERAELGKAKRAEVGRRVHGETGL